MRIIAFGDIHMQAGRLVDLSGLPEAEQVIVTGDLTNFGGKAEADQVIRAIGRQNPNILAVSGNLDRPEVEDFLAEKQMSLHGRGYVRQGIGFFGAGGSSPTPFATPNELSEEELAAILAQGYAMIPQARFQVLVSHTPPFNTNTDRLASGGHAGSRAVRNFIEKNQPDLCLCGHIHESCATDRIGKTVVINPGMLQDGGWVEIQAHNDSIAATLMSLE